ncbi:hypothetical protein GCM10010517_58380 [Streptosporangium fragile]|uniref:Uncharacterized protein n=1 Tax=Streptosporangium fragile TaxID=46186 RepID=A0ABN3W4W7_9ACTN
MPAATGRAIGTNAAAASIGGKPGSFCGQSAAKKQIPSTPKDHSPYRAAGSRRALARAAVRAPVRATANSTA